MNNQQNRVVPTGDIGSVSDRTERNRTAVPAPSTDPVYVALRDLLAEIDRRPADTYHHESFLWRMWATGPLAREALRARHALRSAGGVPS